MLIDVYKQTGVPLQEAFGVFYPSCFLHPLVEYDALVNHAGIFDLTHWRVLSVTGNDRVGFLNAMITNDVTALPAGTGCHSMITTVKGKIIAELFVFARDEDHLVLVAQGDCEEAVATLEKHIINEDVSIADLSNELGVLGIEGPKAEAVVERLFLTGTLALPKDRFGIVKGRFEKFELSVINNTCTGDDGYHIVIPAGEVARIREYLVQAARGSGGFPVGHTAWNIRRVESGIPWYGIDFTGENFPQESRLDHTVSYSKGCFLGQQTLGRLHHQGNVNHLLVGLTVQSGLDTDQTKTDTTSAHVAERLKTLTAEINKLMSQADENGLRARANTDAALFDLSSIYPAGSFLFAGGDNNFGDDAGAIANKSQGRITSAVMSPRLGDCLLLGCVRREVIDSNSVIELPREGTRETLSMIDLPLASSND
jgi:folate-binding protein YgfZ